MDIQPGGVLEHFPQNVLKFGFGDWKNVYIWKEEAQPHFSQDPPKIECVEN